VNIRAFARSHRVSVSAVVLLGIAFATFAVVWFQPQKIFLERSVHEAAPTPAASSPGSSSSSASVVTVASGRFRSLEHRTTGRARLLRLPDGSHVLRIETLDTSNGPDLRVYLSELPSTLGWRAYGEQYVELGKLKGNRGDQNYRVPAGTDVSKYRSLVIWCVRFKVGFGVAPLAA
jgi:Electron transfer DM13